MSESRKKNKLTKKNKFNTLVLEKLKTKYNVSTRFLHFALTGERTSDRAEQIKEEYQVLCNKITQALK